MLGDSQLNVYIVGDNLTPRQRERIQAQVQTALRTLPEWPFSLLRRRLQELGAANFPLIVEPQSGAESSPQALGLGHIEEPVLSLSKGRPAVRLMPLLREEGIDWRQDVRYLLAKAIAYLAAPSASDANFWDRWARAVQSDRLREKASAVGEHWSSAGDLDLLLEMLAAYALNPQHQRWSELSAVRAFLEGWRQGVVDL